MPRTVSGEALCCSFCAKSQFDVVKLVAGPGVFICNECIDLCNQIIVEEMARKSDSPESAAWAEETPPSLRAWDRLSDEELLAEMVRAHAAHQNVDRAVGRHVAALRARVSVGPASANPWE